MSILQAIVLGLVQGATEFAPVSSSGHLILVPWMFGWTVIGDTDLQKSFDVALHLGTLLGALIYFRHDVARYLRALVPIDRRAADVDTRRADRLGAGDRHDPRGDRRGPVRERDPGRSWALPG